MTRRGSFREGGIHIILVSRFDSVIYVLTLTRIPPNVPPPERRLSSLPERQPDGLPGDIPERAGAGNAHIPKRIQAYGLQLRPGAAA